MIARHKVSFALLALCCLLARNLAAQIYEGRELVKPQLLADTTAIVPGKPFTVGLLLHMVPHWHTYWKFSGDAGLPSEMKWHLPSGWKVGEIQWPIPSKMSDPGDIQTYGYENEVLLMQEITPPAAISDASVKLSVDANWLVCEKLCVPGSAALFLDLPIGGQSVPANEELFARYRRSLPQSWPGKDIASADWSRIGAELRLLVTSKALVNYPVIEVFPVPPGNVVVGHPKSELSGDKITFHIPIETDDKNVSSLGGIVVFGQNENGADRNAWSLSSSNVEPGGTESLAATRADILHFLFFGFLGGLILNLMPCVLPVISLKIFGFIQHAGQDRRKIFRSGLAFIAGIFVWFIGLAIVLIALKTAGHEITWAVQFTNPYFVLGMSVVVLAFALNMFGVFEITLPQGATRGLLAWTAGEGDAGSFFQGVFATVLATPCTAPFLGTALGFAFTQSSVIIFLMFLAIAAGMSAPYLLLSAQPAWLRFLPKPGAWMERVKQLMGFFLLATLVFLLYVLGSERGLDAVIWSCGFLLCVSIACWMKGAFLVPTASATTRVISVVLVLVLVIGGGFYFIGEKFRASRLTASAAPSDGDWQAFTPERLQSELAQGRTVFVDFTAAWCLTCKFNEATVLESGDVREAFQRGGIVKMKADWTNADPVITKILKQFGRPGVPLYVLYPSDKSQEPFVFPELLTKSIVLDKLETIAPHIAAH
jgi:thiol:disulfide interchange protein DsbD